MYLYDNQIPQIEGLTSVNSLKDLYLQVKRRCSAGLGLGVEKGTAQRDRERAHCLKSLILRASPCCEFPFQPLIFVSFAPRRQNNNIEEMSGLEHCGNLETLHLDNNCISHLSGLGHNQRLVELRLSGQRIPEDVVFTFDIEVLEAISWSLGLLDLSMCRLVDPRPLSLLRALQKLNIADNLIEEGETLSETLPHLTQLAELSVSGNPVARQQKYRQNTIVCCECLEMLDDREVRDP